MLVLFKKRRLRKEQEVVTEAINQLKCSGFLAFPLRGFGNPRYCFHEETVKKLTIEGFYLQWLDNFNGGCWYVRISY